MYSLIHFLKYDNVSGIMFMWIYTSIYVPVPMAYCFETLLVCLVAKFSHLSTILLTKINNINLIKKRV